MTIYYAKMTCGCCTAKMTFKDRMDLEHAFAMAGLSSSAEITDDNNERFSIDTFYGYWMDEDESRGLDYLADQVNKLL